MKQIKDYSRMMTKSVCPQRILNEAIRLLVAIEPRDEDHEEEIANSITELEDLIHKLPGESLMIPKSPAKAFDAVEDVKTWLGPDRWAGASPEMAKVKDPEQFGLWASFAGVEGYPVEAWYELYHGGGSWAKATERNAARSDRGQTEPAEPAQNSATLPTSGVPSSEEA